MKLWREKYWNCEVDVLKLLIVDLDGTLFDTKDVNYNAYREAIAGYGYEIDYEYYCKFCNGRHYLDFLPSITTTDKDVLLKIHADKKNAYKKHVDKASLNTALVDIIKSMKKECKAAIVTTASKANCDNILEHFELKELFDLILTQEDVSEPKPSPEGFLKAMHFFDVSPEETIIFEDSDVGIEAAERSGAYYYKTYKFN